MKKRVPIFIAFIVLVLFAGCAKMKAKKEMEKGDELYTSGKYDEAIAHYTLAQEAFPESCLPNIKKGDAYLKQKLWQKSKDEFMKALEICPDSISVFERFGDTLVPVVLNGLTVDKDKVMRDSLGAVKSINMAGLGITDGNCLKGIEVYRHSLSNLMLSKNELESIDLSPLKGFESLKVINLNANKLVSMDLVPLSGCTNLASINLSDNEIDEIDLKPLVGLDSLKSINLESNKLDNIDLQVVSNIKNLKSLRLQYNNFSSEKCKDIVEYIGKIERFENFVDPCKKPVKKQDEKIIKFYAYAIAYNYMDGQGYGEWVQTFIPIEVNIIEEMIIIESAEVQKFKVLSTTSNDERIKFYCKDQDGKYPSIRFVRMESSIQFYVDYSNISYVYQCNYY